MSKDEIRELSALETGQYEKLPLADLAAYAMLRIEQMSERLTIENLCVALHRLFPVRFSMVGFPEHPDGMRVNRTLMQMQPKYRNYTNGSAKRGYSLTAIGKAAADSVDRFFDQQRTGNGSKSQPYSRASAEDSKRTSSDPAIVAETKESELFRLFAGGKMEKARGLEFLSLLDAFAHTPKQELRRKLRELVQAAKNTDDDEAVEFLKACQSQFGMLLKDKKKDKGKS